MTRKPCPGCHQPPPWGTYWKRPADSVCAACQAYLEWAKQQRSKTVQPNLVEVAVPPLESVHCWPRFYCGLAGSHTEVRERLEQLLATLFCQLSEEVGVLDFVSGMTVDGVPEYLLNKGVRDGGLEWRMFLKRFGDRPIQNASVIRLIRPDVAQTFRDLYDAIADALIETHADSTTEGRNLLLQLASGGITMEDFNRRAARTP